MTRNDYEDYLNESISDMEYEAITEKYGYLTNPNRPTPVTQDEFDEYAMMGSFGALIRRADPILFNVGYNEYAA